MDGAADRRELQSPPVRSASARIQQLLSIGLTTGLGVLALSWYYTHALTRAPANASHAATAETGQGESRLPPLDPAPPNAGANHLANSPPAFLARDVLTDEPPVANDATPSTSAEAPSNHTTAGSPHPSALDRRLSGSVFARSSTPVVATPAASESPSPQDLSALASSESTPSQPDADRPGALATLLKTRTSPAVSAGILPTQRLLLPKGSFIDCTLETAINSTLPGLTTCITAVDTFSADGKVVLLERGTKLIGETRGEVQQGASRLFVLWTEARTPNGVIVNLDSPGTDELGRSGLPGTVNRHFIDRFGAAILISMIDGAIQGATQSARSGSTVIYNPSASQDVLTEVLKSTVNIPPTVTKRQGDRIQILVARDLDFRSVYALHAR